MEAHSIRSEHGGLPAPRSRKLLAAFGDERLVEQLRRGNETAFEVLYDRHHAGILSYCRHMLGSLHEAEDALQQAFVSAHHGIVTTQKPIRFKAWLYTIARNRCLTMLRARREQPSDQLEVVSTTGLSEEVQGRADLKEILGDLHELPDDQRGALVLSELGDLSHAEVAEVIGCEAAKVKSLVFQARSGLIERRQARETPCEEIREQLATLRGGSLRRGPLRRHLKECVGCAAFRSDVKRQRQMLAIVLPVIPTLGLRDSALAAAGTGAGSAAAGGGVATGAGGISAAAIAKVGAVKIAVVAIAVGGAAVGGGVAVERTLRDDPAPAVPAAETQKAAPNGRAENGAGSVSAHAGPERGASAAAGEAQNGRAHGERRAGSGRDARDFAAEQGNGNHLGLTKTPPGQSKTPPGQIKTPPGQAKTPAGHTKTPPAHTKTPPAHTKTPPGRTRTTPREVPAKPETPQQNGSSDAVGHGDPTPLDPPINAGPKLPGTSPRSNHAPPKKIH
jgi:RNA polymerase sigma factor (sigma-70 family)